MPIMIKIKLKKPSNISGLTKNHDKKQISMKINKRSWQSKAVFLGKKRA